MKNLHLTEICPTCGKVFKITPSMKLRGHGKFCSRDCIKKSQDGEHNPNWRGGRLVDRICVVCGKNFQATKYSVNKGQGETCSDLCRYINHGSKISGDKCVLWKGGISPERQKFYSTEEWKRVAHQVWIREDGTCQNCGKKAFDKRRGFNIHHIIPFSVHETRAVESNLVLLCRDCHRFIHTRKNTNRTFLSELSKPYPVFQLAKGV